MALLTISEAAIKSGFSVELIDGLTNRCPKPGDDRVLEASNIDGTIHVREADLDGYLVYLRSPWPLPAGGNRPRIPDAIARDVREEAHHSCAICGDLNKGELAHIDPVAKTLNNSPDNLLLLCPNHHTEYDYGYKPSSNVTREVVLAAKQMKRASRRRMLRYEGNVAATLRAVLQAVRTVTSTVKTEEDDDLRATYITELQSLLDAIPALSQEAQDAASRDEAFAEEEAALVAAAPKLLAATQGAAAEALSPQLAAGSVISASRDVIVLDEVACPHCSSRGTIGLMGQLCAFCRGDQWVTELHASRYDRDAIDEVPCPHCNGAGMTGLRSALCSYCGGDQVVSTEKADGYDRDAIDEVPCPHCNGAGMTGLRSALCSYCGGDQVVSTEKADGYDRDAIDEVPCPHCDGAGMTGLRSALCSYCDGDRVVSAKKADGYDRDAIDEVPCPHCDGAGMTGLRSALCSYCDGDRVVSTKKADGYNPDAIDEVPCPRCTGAGTTGLGGALCPLCRGDRVVTRAVGTAYRDQRGNDDW